MVLHVNILEREPVARVFTSSGKTYYVDSSARTMPLSDKMNVRIPVFTGFPSDKSLLKGNDLQLLKQVKELAMYISKDAFFKAQIAQVDINASRNFEMIPVVGNHVIEFGNGEHVEAKFRRLFVFYHQVLGQFGFDRYSRINVQYDRQIVGTRRGFTGKIDSVQAVKNIQKLIEDSKKVATDSVFTLVDKNLLMLKKADSTLSVNTAPATRDSSREPTKSAQDLTPVSNPIKNISSQHPLKKPQTNPSNVHDQPQEKPKPKAVMKKLTVDR
jgi:cell division protein FtsQ